LLRVELVGEINALATFAESRTCWGDQRVSMAAYGTSKPILAKFYCIDFFILTIFAVSSNSEFVIKTQSAEIVNNRPSMPTMDRALFNNFFVQM